MTGEPTRTWIELNFLRVDNVGTHGLSQNHAVALTAGLIRRLDIGTDLGTKALNKIHIGADPARGKNHGLGIDAIEAECLPLTSTPVTFPLSSVKSLTIFELRRRSMFRDFA